QLIVIRRINHDGIDHVGIGIRFLPSLTSIERFPESLSSPGVQNSQVDRILQNDMSPAICSWNSLHLRPVISAVDTPINPAARAGEDPPWIGVINSQRENIRIINHTLMNRVPSCPPVKTPPWEVCRAGIDDSHILRVQS